MELLFGLVVLLVIVGIYIAPSLIAADRGVSSVWSVVAINVFLGWTLVGWVAALALALRDPKEKPTPVPAAPVNARDEVERLQQLVDLHSRGVLSDEEFASAKSRVLKPG